MSSTVAGMNPENVQNAEAFEMQMAVKAVEQSETYWGLLQKIKGSKLRLTKLDDDMHAHFLEAFPEYASAERLQKLDEDEIKSAQNKPRWREWMMQYEKKVSDYNFASLLRVDSAGEYTQTNTIFVPKMQFYIFEIARNRHSLNDWVFEKAVEEKKAEKAKAQAQA